MENSDIDTTVSARSEDALAKVSTPSQEGKSTLVDFFSPKFERFLYPFKKVTHKSTISHPELSKTPNAKKEMVERSLNLRRVRGRLYDEFKKTQKSEVGERRNIISQAKERDRIAKEFLNQGDVHVTLPDLGEQTARYTVMNADQQEKPAVVIVPGISNDIDSIEGHAQEAASRGRKVVALGYPEGYGGTVTEEFAKDVEAKGDFTTHSIFFEAAIKALVGEDSDIELRGLSTGAPIVAQILSNPEFAKRVSDAVLISPAASIDQSTASMNFGFLSDAKSFITDFPDMASSFVWFKDKIGGVDPKQKALRKRVMPVLQKAIAKKSPYWQSMRVKDGGKITVVTGGRDEITKSYQAEDEFSKNPQVQVLSLPQETHVSSFNNPEVLAKIEEIQSN